MTDYNFHTSSELLTSVLADDLSLESEWLQVSLGLRDSSQYCGQFQHNFNSLDIPLTSNSSSPFFKSLGSVPSTLVTIGITVTFMSHSFFSSLARSKYLYLFSLCLIFTLWSVGTANSTIRQVLVFSLLRGAFNRFPDYFLCRHLKLS